jgi:hypothetical protein
MEDQVVDGLSWKTQNNELVVVHKNPYGFMHFQFTKGGPVPVELQGAYTNITDATKAGEAYIKKHPRTHNADKERPVLQTKKVGKKAMVKAEEIKEELQSTKED